MTWKQLFRIAAAAFLFVASGAHGQSFIGGGLSVDADTFTATITKAGGASANLALAPGKDVRAYGAKGDATGISSCSIAAASAVLTCSSASFTSADVGKYYYLQGSDAANAPQTGTIVGYNSPTSVTLSNAAVVATPQSGIYCSPASCPTILAAGSGYTNGTQTLTITGGTCTTQPQVSVTVAANVVTAVLSMVDPGVCTVVPPSGSATTGGGGTGATFTTVGYQAAGRFLYGTDDTAAIQAAVTAAAGGVLIFPPGGYWLATASAPITLNSIAIKGSGKTGFNYPFVSSGSWLVLSNKSTASFNGMSGVTWDGLNVYYPEQDNSTVSPVVFPALFESSQFVNDSFQNFRIANGYNCWNVTTGSGNGWGRVYFRNIDAFCANRYVSFANGAADFGVYSPDVYFGPGGFDGGAVAGPANLARYAATSGEIVHVDIAGASKDTIDGLTMVGTNINGTAYGIRVVSGTINVSTITGVNFDQTLTPLSVEGASSSLVTTAWTGGEIYSTNNFDTSLTRPVFNFATQAATTSFLLSGVKVSYALGSVVSVTGTGITSLTVTGNDFQNFGRSTTVGTYTGVNMGAGGSGTMVVSGNLLSCNRVSSTVYGVSATGASGFNATITGNAFKSCSFGVNAAGAAGKWNVTGNGSTLTIGATSFSDSTTTANALVTGGNNTWDKVPTSRAPTVTSCGSGSPTVAATSSWQRGSVVIPTVATACTVTFPATLPYAPTCSINTSNSGIAAAITSTSTSNLVAAFSADMAGATLYWSCGL